MKMILVTVAAGVVVFLGTMVPAWAQHDQPADKQVEADKQPKGGPLQPQRTQQEALAWQQRRGWLQQGGGWQIHDTWQQGRANRWDSDHRTWAQRGGYGGSYIPQASFDLHFGSQHSFRLSSRPVMYLGYPRFEYAGFSFMMVDPWPEYWPNNWYDLDDVYIDYDEGYYLYDASYSHIKLAIAVVSPT
jgi:hypothetical protein